MPDSDSVSFRVYANAAGKVYLFDEGRHLQIEVQTPVSEQSLEIARCQLLNICEHQSYDERRSHEGRDEKSASAQQLANRQIKAVVQPQLTFSQSLARLKTPAVIYALGFAMLLILPGLMVKAIQNLYEQTPEGIFLTMSLANIGVLGFCLYFMATEQNRGWRLKLSKLFGRGVAPGSTSAFLIVPCTIILYDAACTLAGLTLILSNHHLVVFESCARPPVERVESVAFVSLFEFYMWHFFNLVPFLKLNETLNWVAPLCYTQKRVGFLILLFQALVVFPIIAAMRFYLKGRHSLDAKPKFLYEPGWRPVITNEYRTKQNHLFDDRRQ